MTWRGAVTWLDRDQGCTTEFTCGGCGRGTYLANGRGPAVDRLKCRGCGKVVEECLCPPVPKQGAIP